MAIYSVDVHGNVTPLKKDIQAVSKTQTVTVNVKSNGKSIKTISDQMVTLDGNTKKTTTSTTKFNDAQQVVGKTTKTVTKELQGAGVASQSLGQKFTDIIKKVSTFGLATAIIGLFTKGIHEAVSTVKEFDDALTDFKKVSDLSGEALDTYTKKLGEMGIEVARTRKFLCESV